jgi:hypothetical protein
MPTVIHFGEGNVALTGAEEPDQVEEAYVESDGRPFKLNGMSVRGEVYINPARVCYWHGASAKPGPPHPGPPGGPPSVGGPPPGYPPHGG